MAGEIVTSCPLCLALSDPADMIDVEINRVVPKGRAHVLLCRSCASAAVRVMAQAGEPLAKELIELDKKEAERPPTSADTSPPGSPSGAGEHEGEIRAPQSTERGGGEDDDKSAA